MQITISGDIGVLFILLFTILLFVSGIILERVLKWYFKKCIKKGVEEYQGRKIKHLSEDQMERWQRFYMHSINNPRRLGIITQLPYFVATTIILIVVFIPMAMISGPDTWWVLFPVWMFFLTILSLGRAGSIAAEFERMRKQ
ncbi:MAG: hypothetical protein ACFFE2_00205 [Candidatus Thorarchaeota archaeon]